MTDPYRHVRDGSAASDGGSRRWLLVIGVVVVFGAFAASLWWVYQRGVREGSDSTAPVIKADTAPVKVKPTEPGGIDVPNRDKLVYEKIGPNGTTLPAVEQLLPPPEQPTTTRPAPANGASGTLPQELLTPRAAVPGESDGVPAPPEITTPPQPAPAPAATPAETTPPAAPAEAAPPPAPAPADRPAPARQPEVAAGPAAAGPYRLQLASMRSPEAAREAWDKLRSRHADVLSRFDLVVEEVDLGTDRGLFYRVQAGPVASQGEADALCDALKQRQVGCLVVRR